MNRVSSQAQLHERLEQVIALLERHDLGETARQPQPAPTDRSAWLLQQQDLAELHDLLQDLHPADVAYVIESLPPDPRLVVWRDLDAQRAGEVFFEVSDAVRESLVESSTRDEMVAALKCLDADDLALAADNLPEDVLLEVSRALDVQERTWLQSSIAHPEDSVGHLTSHEFTVVKDDATLDEVLEKLRELRELPEQTDQIFVVDSRNVLAGSLPLMALLVRPAAARVADFMTRDLTVFTPQESADDAAKAFERYDLVSAPVVDERGRLLGRLTVDDVMDFIREQSENEALQRAGLSGDEDLFARAWDSARNRWLWLGVNLVTAFVASRVIGFFEHTIERLVALATLMPIVASMGGNTGNQTTALVIRGLALDQINPSNTWHLVFKELAVSVLNGLMWGSLMGLFAFVLYRSVPLGLVMAAAILLNLIVAALVGIGAPMLLHRAGRDPAQGSSVLLTFTTDSAGFFIFLGLARIFLG